MDDMNRKDMTEEELEALEKEQQEAESGVYAHKLKKPFEWEGETYTELRFDYASLRGSDLAEVEDEMSAENKYAIIPEYSIAYVLKLAARAAGVHSSVIETLPLADANIIRKKTRSFFMHGE